jgi:putative ABC transport system permease protein
MSPILADGQPNVILGKRPLALWNSVTPGYFRTLGIPLLRGRDLTWADDDRAARVVVVNQTLARRFWPNQDAIGKHLVFTRAQTPFEIVGVVADTKSFGLEAEPGLIMYSSYAQWTWPRMVINVRTESDPRLFARVAPAQIHAVDPDLPVTNVQSADEFLSTETSQRRQTAYLIAAFALLAMVLSVVGLYGLMAYFVAQRTTEIGIRRAVGAQTGDILRLVMVQAARLAAAGIAVGVVAAAGLTRLMAGMLFRVSATDPVTYAAIAAIFLAVALAASYIPAFRATRVDPLEALRSR